MNILIATAEAWPFVKVGGLGDVAGALPKALKERGVDARVIMPQYKGIPSSMKKSISHKIDFYINLGWRRQYCGINQVEHEGVIFYFIDNEYYFGREDVYGHYDDGERFAFFSKAVLEAIPYLDFKIDVIHCNDWHTALIPVLLNNQYKCRDYYTSVKTLYTIHNLNYQGIMPQGTLMNLLGIGFDEKLEYHGCENLAKGGLSYSDGISAVSPSYADEIQEPSGGEGLDGVLRERSSKLWGILNGIDYEAYNPENDKCIFKTYNLNTLHERRENKLNLQEEVGLPQKEDVLLIGMVSRLVEQKGLNLVEQSLDYLSGMDVQLIVLGSGEKKYEDMFRNAAGRYKEKVAALIGFSDGLARRIYAGADLFLMPSLVEPCGLSQLIALRYGAIPLVRATGGLKDTVHSFNPHTGEGNGFSFPSYRAEDMVKTIGKVMELYKNQDAWQRLQKNAMSEDYSWSRSAHEYAKLYQSLIGQ